ncbi:hypothetical protein [Ruegeria sp. HKCCD8929]|uniref:hypothetical protein n=1 Tax=Ruegeria sp. HKCCD8929 TaxID=2683006 RepID=UPI001489A04C|nr:hypothetical protein [Ruegeria sp. HKCCD8929]
MISEQEFHVLEQDADSGLPFQVSLRAINKSVGLAAFGLPFALLVAGGLGGACPTIDSISHYYFTRIGGDILVGALSFIGVLLLFFYKLPDGQTGTTGRVDGYLGHKPLDIWLARLAGLCAWGVAFFPTDGAGCESFDGSTARVFLNDAKGGDAFDPPTVTGVPGFDFWAGTGVTNVILTNLHFISAGGMFLILAYFSIVVFRRPQSKTCALRAENKEIRLGANKGRRNRWYLIFGLLILLAIAALVIKALVFRPGTSGLDWWNRNDLTFWFEALALVAFGLSWSMKGRLWPFGRMAD